MDSWNNCPWLLWVKKSFLNFAKFQFNPVHVHSMGRHKTNWLEHIDCFIHILWLLMTWLCKEPSPSSAGIFQPQVPKHYNDIIMSTMVSQITSLTIVYSIIYSGTDERKHQSSASLAFVWGIHRWPVSSPYITWKMFPFDDVIMGLRHVANGLDTL